jgi:hypothetical protein
MANQESHYQRVKNAFTPFLLVREDYNRNDKIAQAEIVLNEKLNQLGYIDGQDITGQFIRITTMPQSLDLRERFRPLSDRLDIDFTRLLREFFNSPEYRQARRARAAAAAERIAQLREEEDAARAAYAAARAAAEEARAAYAAARAAAEEAVAEEARAAYAAARAAAEEAVARIENVRQRLAAILAAHPALLAAHAAAAPPQRARKNRKTRVRSRKMRKTRKNSSR